jgi:multidrug efflux system outer membrane protein
MSKFFVLSSAIFLTACAVGKNYQEPVTALPSNFSQAQNALFSNNDVAVSWWQIFQDKQLNALINQSLKHNYDIQAASATLREARELYSQAEYNFFPTVTAKASYNEQQRSVGALNNRDFVPRDLKLFNMGFDASWELDLFGRIERSVESSRDEMQAQEATLRDVNVSVIAEIARNYFELRGLQNQLAVLKENIDYQSQLLDLIRAKLHNGRGTEFDVVNATAQLDNLRSTAPNLMTTIQSTIHRLSVLTGQIPSALTQELTPVAPLPAAPKTLAIGKPETLLRRRPDIKIAEHLLASSTAKIGVATADLFPKVTFVGNISLESTLISNLVGAGSQSYSFGPRISWAAFDLGRVYARMKAADANAEANLAHYQQTVLNALEETENALNNYNHSLQSQLLLESSAKASEQACKLALLRYEKGASDFSSVLESQLQLVRYQSQLAQNKTTTATTLTALYKALGGGWEITEKK